MFSSDHLRVARVDLIENEKKNGKKTVEHGEQDEISTELYPVLRSANFHSSMQCLKNNQ